MAIEPIIEELRPAPSGPELFARLQGEPGCFFLDSAMEGGPFGQYSFLGARPFLIIRSKGEAIDIIQGDQVQRRTGNPFDIIEDLLNQYQIQSPSDKNIPPFLGGAVGYFGYDLCHHIEELPRQSVDDLNLPDCTLGFYDTVLIVDHATRKSYIAATGLPELDPDRAHTCAEERIKEMRDALSQPVGSPSHRSSRGAHTSPIVSNFSKAHYVDAVIKAKEYIAAGDIYQVNLSQRLSTKLTLSPQDLYLHLRRMNPAPFAAFLHFEPVTVVSSSPERFLRISDRHVQTRPIKGTRRRGRDPLEDARLAQELWNSEKDRAELVMIVDLERNDLGRVCEYGSVHVPELITMETYPTVFHLVSTVEGTLRPDVTHIGCLRACFPGGSITGAPKIRAMEIIDELEPTQRGIYTGAIGYMGFNRETDLNIVIRTMVLVRDRIYFQVGGGIVADSDPEAEYIETLDKARALIKAARAG